MSLGSRTEAVHPNLNRSEPFGLRSVDPAQEQDTVSKNGPKKTARLSWVLFTESEEPKHSAFEETYLCLA